LFYFAMSPPEGSADAVGTKKRKFAKIGGGSFARRTLRVAPGEVAPRDIRSLLPRFKRQVGGRCFGLREFRSFLQKALACKPKELPTDDGCLELLRRTVRYPKPLWQVAGLRYQDAYGSSEVSNVSGFHKQRGLAAERVIWHEYGSLFRLRESSDAGLFEIVKLNGARKVGFSVSRQQLRIRLPQHPEHEDAESLRLEGLMPEEGRELMPQQSKRRRGPGRPRESLQCRAVVFDPLLPLGSCVPQWSLIYLHMFSCKGADYVDYPHYFGIADAAVRVVLPTAPLQDQDCFSDWWVRSPRSQKWALMKFNSWFNYRTNHCGKKENAYCLESVLECRRLIHNVISEEVKRVGDPRRVIIGGASQGGCAALDAAYTYPEELGGAIGVVTHLLSSTPLNPEKKSMPVHLFHEPSDEEMNWGFVQGTVQRMKDEGCNVVSRRERDPCNGGHHIGHIEGTWIRRALRELTSRDDAAQKKG